MVTLNPAKQLRIDQRVGSLDVGKDADVVLWNAHPLSTDATVDKTFIDGIAYYDREQSSASPTWSRRKRRAPDERTRRPRPRAARRRRRRRAKPGNLFNIESQPSTSS